MNQESSTEEIGRFLDFMYGDQTGFAYSATKDPSTEHWEQYFFQWPVERESLINHITRFSTEKDVYYGPALYTSRSGEKDAFKVSNVMWVEFDGKIPSKYENLPTPSLILRSSESKNQHWYWKLDSPINSVEALEEVVKRLTYHLEGDFGCWNANRVLRPPRTKHQDSGKTTEILRWDQRTVSLSEFANLPDLPFKMLSDTDINYVPEALDVIMKYQFQPDAIDLFKAKEIKKTEGGGRSAALTKLAFYCVETELSNAETLSVLTNADSRWGKFVGRGKDRQKKHLIDIINYCRSKKPIDPVEKQVDNRLRVYTYEEFKATEINIEWIIPNLLHKKGFASLSGPPAVGKSQITLRFAEKLAKGEPFLKWPAVKPTRTLFVSMEMPHEELKYITDQMQISGDADLLRENFLLMPIGSSVRLNNKKAQDELKKVIDEFQPEGIFFDSLGIAIGEDLNSEKVIFESFDFVNSVIRRQYSAFVWFIHHHRKAQIGNKKPNKLDDMYGNQYIGAQITSALGLWPTGDTIEFSCLKMRLAEMFNPFRIKRTPGLDFKLLENQSFADRPISEFSNLSGLEDSI